jgi:hypothetical protein
MRSYVPWADPRPEIVRGVDAALAAQLLDHVEQLPAGATGALVVGHIARPEGTILVEAGRVCWAVAGGMQQRLTDILCHQATPALDRHAVESIYRRCRAESLPLGEMLVREGLVSADGLRRALRQHTGEAVAALAREGGTPTWIDHRRRGYDARFTFSAAELLVGIGAWRTHERAAEARAILESLVDPDGRAVAFARCDESATPCPVAAIGAGEFSVRALVDLGRWAASTLDVAAAFCPERSCVALVGDDGHAALAALHHEFIVVVSCDDASTLACTIVRHRRTR